MTCIVFYGKNVKYRNRLTGYWFIVNVRYISPGAVSSSIDSAIDETQVFPDMTDFLIMFFQYKKQT